MKVYIVTKDIDSERAEDRDRQVEACFAHWMQASAFAIRQNRAQAGRDFKYVYEVQEHEVAK